MIQGDPSSEVVYRDPYCSLRKTVNLFTSSPNLANSVGRIVFDGFYSPETNVLILQALQNCNLLDCVSLPWTVLRYGTVEDWSKLLAPKQERSALSSLELLAVDLKQSQIMDQVRRFDKRPLESPQVSFEHLKRLKLFGSSNLMPINDDDLVAIARTAQLEEIHITGTTSISTKGLMALGRASRETLRILEHSPLSDDGFKHPDAARPHDDSHLCREIVGCPRLKSLAVSLPTLCRELFMDHSVSWAGDVQIRAGGLCGNELSLRQSIEAQRELFDILSQARTLIEARQESGIELNIELFIGRHYFPSCLRQTSLLTYSMRRASHLRAREIPCPCRHYSRRASFRRIMADSPTALEQRTVGSNGPVWQRRGSIFVYLGGRFGGRVAAGVYFFLDSTCAF